MSFVNKRNYYAWVGFMIGACIGLMAGMGISNNIILHTSFVNICGIGLVLAGISGLTVYAAVYFIGRDFPQWWGRDSLQFGVAFAISTMLICIGWELGVEAKMEIKQMGFYCVQSFVAGYALHWMVICVAKFLNITTKED